jgi:hypothetical protein
MVKQISITLLVDARYNSINHLAGETFEIGEDVYPLWLERGICARPGAAQQEQGPPQEETPLEEKLLAMSVEDLAKIADGLPIEDIPEDKLDLVLAIIEAGYTG